MTNVYFGCVISESSCYDRTRHIPDNRARCDDENFMTYHTKVNMTDELFKNLALNSTTESPSISEQEEWRKWHLVCIFERLIGRVHFGCVISESGWYDPTRTSLVIESGVMMIIS